MPFDPKASCPHCHVGQLASPGLSEAFGLTLKAWANPLKEFFHPFRSILHSFSGRKEARVWKCKSCAGYAIQCAKCYTTIKILGTPSENQFCECPSCKQGHYLLR